MGSRVNKEDRERRSSGNLVPGGGEKPKPFAERDYDEEMGEFAKMEDEIKDMDFLKAETQAARNGHTAAIELAESWKKQFAVVSADNVLLEKEVDRLRLVVLSLVIIGGVFAGLFGITLLVLLGVVG